jgi:molybdate transport repressor ModE-like protein
METFQDLRLFIRVARAGSLSAAGRESGLSAASMWRHLNALEQRLGAPLLLRSSRGIKLTDAGAAFAERAEAIIAQFDEAAEVVSAFLVAPRGSLHTPRPA